MGKSLKEKIPIGARRTRIDSICGLDGVSTARPSRAFRDVLAWFILLRDRCMNMEEDTVSHASLPFGFDRFTL
jgi:hypothetical protein